MQIRFVRWSRWDGTLAFSLSSLVLYDQHTAPGNLGITQNTEKVPDELCWFLHWDHENMLRKELEQKQEEPGLEGKAFAVLFSPTPDILST